MISNEYSVLSDLKWSKRRIGEYIHYPIDQSLVMLKSIGKVNILQEVIHEI